MRFAGSSIELEPVATAPDAAAASVIAAGSTLAVGVPVSKPVSSSRSSTTPEAGMVISPEYSLIGAITASAITGAFSFGLG